MTWFVVSRHRESGLYLIRDWEGDDAQHAMEQHIDAFDDEEEVVCASITEPDFFGSVLA